MQLKLFRIQGANLVEPIHHLWKDTVNAEEQMQQHYGPTAEIILIDTFVTGDFTLLSEHEVNEWIKEAISECPKGEEQVCKI